MHKVSKIAIFIAVLLIVSATVSTITFADAPQYKQSFSAQMNGDGEIVPTSSTMMGSAQFNVSMDERTIGYTTSVNGSYSSIVLECLVGSNDVYQIASLATLGSLTESDLMENAQKCNPNIFTTSHLVQAMREGKVYVNVLTSAYPMGEIRGKVIDGALPPVTIPTPTLTPTPTPTVAPTPAPTPTPAPETPAAGSSSNGSGSTVSSTSGGSGYVSNPGQYFIPTTQGSTTPSTGTTRCSYLKDYIGSHLKNDPYQVTLLQIFLNKEMKADLTLNGIYDLKTISSVNAFQLKYSNDVLKPWMAFGLPTSTTTTSFVYKTTSWKINSIACGMTLPQPMLP